NALTFAEFHRWAGSLKEDFSRILAENLSILLATDRIALFPWTRVTPIDYRVTATVIRFEGKVGGDVTLKIRWSILGGAGKKVLVMKTSNFSEPVGGVNYEALVAAQSRTLAGLSREIAETINTISR
ncbi:MAG: PqiC family protein, partial [Candidatus Desulfatibia sp.]|uniref:PqiC family protein n=1 Tax=Candidatus Desulfatibia sp. TaxID=3101189 RepID=UPI002F33A7D3